MDVADDEISISCQPALTRDRGLCTGRGVCAVFSEREASSLQARMEEVVVTKGQGCRFAWLDSCVRWETASLEAILVRRQATARCSSAESGRKLACGCTVSRRINGDGWKDAHSDRSRTRTFQASLNLDESGGAHLYCRRQQAQRGRKAPRSFAGIDNFAKNAGAAAGCEAG